MQKRATAMFLGILLAVLFACPVYASDVPKTDTPNYKVAFYYFDCYHMQDEDGKRSGYGYEMMQNISKYLQCTFSYVGYDKTAQECEQMLRDGEIDIQTAARITPERQEEFAFSKHPAITANTCMNVKAGNTSVIAGDYSTYDGLRIGLLRRHTYNESFLAFAKEKGFDCEILYYETPTELSKALIDGEVDALVNSYIGIPEDERVVENFGQTAYYIMARKEDQALIDQLDYAIDCMNVETPTWRTELYNRYYGQQGTNREFTSEEQALLKKLQDQKAVIKGVMNPDANPYSWFEDGEAKGIAADIFRATAKQLGLDYEILPAETAEEYKAFLDSGEADVWMDLNGYYEEEGSYKYKITDSYLSTSVSVLRLSGSTGKIKKLAVTDEQIETKEIIGTIWPQAELVLAGDKEDCVRKILSGEVDGALLLTYTAQKLARSDIQNRLSVDIVPGASMEFQMGINVADDVAFYGLWEKTLSQTAEQTSAEIVQGYLEDNESVSMISYLFDHPYYMVLILTCIFLTLFFIVLYLLSVRSKNQQQQTAVRLAEALKEAEAANEAKQDFFSKMSHDIRTPLNVVLGMTQIALKYKDEPVRLETALGNITTEGNHLLVLINSILDVNQLEHGHMELTEEPFNPAECLRDSVEILRPLAEKKEQELVVSYDRWDQAVVGDSNRCMQILINIISNAIKYTDMCGRIELSLRRLDGDVYQFVCRDNGIGMSEEFVQHICEDYVRAEDSRISKIQGTGLGMSVVRGFTELMGGRLKIDSQLGEGSTFTVEIPFREATAEQREQVLHPVTEDGGSKMPYHGKRVLLAEDNALNAEIAMELLQSLGFTVDWAEDGKMAVEQFEASEPGSYFAIFMDMQMPVMDGVTATRAIRSSNRSDRNVPIFAMTANTFTSDRKVCRDAGMDGYISKPVNVKDIISGLKEVVS